LEVPQRGLVYGQNTRWGLGGVCRRLCLHLAVQSSMPAHDRRCQCAVHFSMTGYRPYGCAYSSADRLHLQLPVEQIICKTVVITFEIRHTAAPAYFSSHMMKTPHCVR